MSKMFSFFEMEKIDEHNRYIMWFQIYVPLSLSLSIFIARVLFFNDFSKAFVKIFNGDLFFMGGIVLLGIMGNVLYESYHWSEMLTEAHKNKLNCTWVSNLIFSLTLISFYHQIKFFEISGEPNRLSNSNPFMTSIVSILSIIFVAIYSYHSLVNLNEIKGDIKNDS